MMGAGNASSSLYKCNPNEPTGGGNKKQGISPRVGLNNWSNREVQTQSNGLGRFRLVFQNQLGGVGAGNSMFGGQWNRADGLSKTLEEKQLEITIKQDENNGVIIPLEKRIVRSSSRVGGSSPTKGEITYSSTGNQRYIFSVKNTSNMLSFGIDKSSKNVLVEIYDSNWKKIKGYDKKPDDLFNFTSGGIQDRYLYIYFDDYSFTTTTKYNVLITKLESGGADTTLRISESFNV